MNFSNIMDSVMYNAKQLRWIDLSHNYLETLDYVNVTLLILLEFC